MTSHKGPQVFKATQLASDPEWVAQSDLEGTVFKEHVVPTLKAYAAYLLHDRLDLPDAADELLLCQSQEGLWMWLEDLRDLASHTIPYTPVVLTPGMVAVALLHELTTRERRAIEQFCTESLQQQTNIVGALAGQIRPQDPHEPMRQIGKRTRLQEPTQQNSLFSLDTAV